jgi:hypothetical protein
MLRKVLALIAVMLFGIGTLRAMSPPQSPVQGSTSKPVAAHGVEALWAYAGTWKVEINHLDSAFSKAGHETNSLHNDCWKSGIYVACRQIVDGDPKVLIVFTCAKADGSCTSYQIPPDGGQPGSGTLLIEGNTWTFPWSMVKDGLTTYFRVVNVWSTPTTIDYRQEFSTDQVHWTPTATGHEVKISDH